MSDGFKDSLGSLTGCYCMSAGHTSITCPKHQLSPYSIELSGGDIKTGTCTQLKQSSIDTADFPPVPAIFSQEGVKFDEGKPSMSLLPSKPLVEVAKVLDYGKRKYAAHNWRQGIDYSRLYSATQRHLSSWNENEDIDDESKLNHLAHAACDILFLLEYELNKQKYSKFDDRYKGDK